MNIKTTLTLIALATSVAATHAAPAFASSQTEMPSHKMEMAAMATTGKFTGIEVKKGSAELYMKNGRTHLRVSKDFAVPMSPAPHWQVVDKEGNVFLLNQFRLAGDKMNLDIKLPSYIKSVSKVQVWCSFAEVVLGEASFSKTVVLK